MVISNSALSAAQLRVAKRRERIEEERKAAAAKKDALSGAMTGEASSARGHITRSLHQREEPAQATSVGRLNAGRGGAGLPGSGLAPPPKLPGKF